MCTPKRFSISKWLLRHRIELFSPKLTHAAVWFGCDDWPTCLPFCCCNCDLDPMTCICKLDPYSLEIYWMCENKLPTSKFSKKILYYSLLMHAFSSVWSLLVTWRWQSHHWIHHIRIPHATHKPHYRTGVMGDQRFDVYIGGISLIFLAPVTLTSTRWPSLYKFKVKK